MKLSEIIGLVALVGGVLLLVVVGINASRAREGEMGQDTPGGQTAGTVAYIVGGVAVVAVGAGLMVAMIVRKRREKGPRPPHEAADPKEHGSDLE